MENFIFCAVFVNHVSFLNSKKSLQYLSIAENLLEIRWKKMLWIFEQLEHLNNFILPMQLNQLS